ncbi:MAG: hypothetical protein WCD70_08440 [Alphaproteobacteria bacterium]
MSDFESYLVHCYDLLLNKEQNRGSSEEEEQCACAKLIDYQDHQTL